MNLTIFAGTFNPIHTAHLIIAEGVRSELDLAKIMFIPSCVPPHRDNNIVSASHRFNMVKLAISENPYFEASDIELKLQGVSYTYNTILKLYEDKDIKGKINFIIGADAFNKIDSWYKYKELADLVNFVVLARPKSLHPQNILNNIQLSDFSYQFVEVPQVDISSSFIRQKIKEKKSIKYLVSKQVEEYIIDKELYN